MEKEELISQGAEAKIYKVNYLGDIHIKKERFTKQYRHPDLDTKITKERIKSEAKNMVKARSIGVNTPYIIHVDTYNKSIYMQYINNSLKLKEYIEILRANLQQNQIKLDNIIESIGKLIAVLHNNDIIHGDLTTSNILVSFIQNPEELNVESVEYEEIYFIDFGLSYQKNNVEDKAVDLYVLERAFLSTHPNMESSFEFFINKYEEQAKGGDKIIAKLNEVRMRGRKKLAFG